ncbi:nucleolar protein 9 [Diorhabda carinulata]|uniref:nucleolar protein 9 n=1 Tax=Diorhabda carinulata TaxID=1163345 RepID=UPI0025A28751|nr:nucleolar protein 9 [Diorhabda carinulata]
MEESSNKIINKKNNRKRKKSFLKNARKYAKKGHFGRGSQLDSDTYHYFVKILETFKDGFDSEEDKKVFANNVFEQTKDQEINCCCNQVGCRVIELLLPYANNDIVKQFLDVFSEDIRPLISDRFASHVLECLVSESCKRTFIENTPQEMRLVYQNFAIKVSKFLLNNLEDYMWDTYGNHVIRSCLIHLIQLPTDNSNTDKQDIVIPNEFSDIVKEYGERIISWPQFEQLCMSDLTSGFLQVLMKCLKNTDPKLLKSYSKKLLEVFNMNSQEDKPKHLPSAFGSQSVVMLLETCLQLVNSKLFMQLYNSCFSGNLVELSTIKMTNFAVQKLIQHCQEKEHFEGIYDELVDNFPAIIEVGHSGILLSLSEACKKFRTRQGSFVQQLMKALDCFEPEERQNSLILCLCRFTTYENNLKKAIENLQKEKLNLHGTLILQKLLDYNKPIKIVNALLNLDQNVLLNLFSNTMGSHVVDSYVRGEFVGEKSREKLVRKMMGVYKDLASSKFGSRSFEALWNVANLKCKLQIIEELSHKDASWVNSEFGKIISNKINYLLYKRNKEEWKNSLNKSKENKKEQLLAKVLN